jgi:hypothetical protein
MLHEEWLVMILRDLGTIAERLQTGIYGADRNFADHVETLAFHVRTWADWSRATDLNERIAILERAGL